MKTEQCTFHTKCVVTAENREDILQIMSVAEPSPTAAVGDTVTLNYRVDIRYLGQVAENLEAMLRLNANYVGDQSSSNVLIKRVFSAFSKWLP